MDNKKNNHYLITLIILLGIVLQLFTLFFVIDPDTLFWSDPHHYYSISKDLYEGKQYSTIENERNLYRSPGYPYILSIMMKIVGTKIINLRLFHILLFPLFLISLYKLGSLWKSKKVGLFAAFFGAIYPLYIYIPISLYPQSISIYITPAIAIIMYLLRKKFNYLLLLSLSIIISLIIMFRPTNIVFIPTVLIYILWRKKYTTKRIISVIIIIILIPFICVAGWSLRNKIVHGRYIFSTAGSINLFITYN